MLQDRCDCGCRLCGYQQWYLHALGQGHQGTRSCRVVKGVGVGRGLYLLPVASIGGHMVLGSSQGILAMASNGLV